MSTDFTHPSHASWQTIDRAKQRFPETTLVAAGEARAVIVIPERPAYQAQAQKLQRSIFQQSGVTVPIVWDTAIDPWQPPTANQILLGNLMDNQAVAPLYHRHYLAADAHYPGPGGHVVRTIHDPWGNGHNAILTGGSDIAGVTTSVQSLCHQFQQQAGRLWLPQLLEIQIGEAFLRTFPEMATIPDATFRAAEMAKAHEMLETGAHGGITDPLGRAGMYYAMTGHLGWAKLFKELVFLMYADFQKGREQYGGAWGMDADFRLFVMLPAWDLVEEAPIFSDEERLQITRIYAQFIEDAIPHAADAVQHRRTRHNHWTFAALGLLYSAQYFEKYYGIAEAEDWLYVADECFVPQCHTARSHENSNGYQWLTLSHALAYALARPYPAFFTEGHVRTIADLAIVSMDNLGYQSSYGDTRTIYGWGTELPILAAAAWYYGDGRYQWALNKTDYDAGFRIGLRTLGTHLIDMEPVEPTDLTGARRVPLDPTFHHSFEGHKTVPVEAAYDKVVFRADYDPKSEYLLLDGLAVGGHKHYDCNALIRLTALDRIWLADGDYYCSAPNFHNGVLPLANGETTIMPPFTWCDFVVDLPATGFSRTTVKAYGEADWERNILWRKGRYFLVADVMRARRDAAYDFRAQWQVIGATSLHGQRLEVAQQERRLDIINADEATLSTAVDSFTTAEWDAYAHADPTITILRQNHSTSLQQNATDVFLNILHPRWATEAPLTVKRLTPASLLVQEPDGLVWLAVRTADPLATPCQTDAQSAIVDGASAAVVQATTFGCDGPLFSAEHPVDLTFDWASGQGTISATLPTLLTFHQLDATALQVDGWARPLRRTGETLIFSVPPGQHTFALTLSTPAEACKDLAAALQTAWAEAAEIATQSTATTTATTEETPPRWQITAGTFTAVATVGTEAIAAGTADGRLYLLDRAGEIQWQRQVDGEVTQITAADFGARGTVIAVGTLASSVTLFSFNGEECWRHSIPFYKRDGIVRTLVAADINGDGLDEIIVGAENWHHYVLDQQGATCWHFESVHASTATAVADIDNDGAPELIAATEYNWWFAVSNQGEKKWQHNTVLGMGVTHVATARQRDGTHLVAFGCRDGTVQVVDANGKVHFVLQTADTIKGLAAADINGDGNQEFLVASAIQNTYAVAHTGEILWRTGNQSPPTYLLLDPALDSSSVWVAESDGQLLTMNAEGQTEPRLHMGGAATALALCPTPSGQLVVAALQATGLRAWEV